MDRIRIGICGTGIFARKFIPVFQAHPDVEEVVLCDTDPARLKAAADEHGVARAAPDAASLFAADVHAVAIFTPRHRHADIAIRALEAGKHVYCAVPAAQTVEELETLVDLTRRTGLTYMIGETSYYYPASIYCRRRAQAGHLGDFVYGEGEYLHDMAHGFYEAFRLHGGPEWKQRAGFPPMLYPTHSTAMLVATTGARLEKVSCLGYKDRHPDGIFRKDANLWNNEFSNETALFRTSDGGSFRVNEFRRVGHGAGNCVRASLFGTHGCFEQQADSHIWTDINKALHELNGLLECDYHPQGRVEEGVQEDFNTGLSRVHPVQRIPEPLFAQPNGHSGSHYFLVDDFVRSVRGNKLPPNHVWNAARYTAPGIVAHESALNDGEMRTIPDFGEPPETMPRLEDELATISEEGRRHIDATPPDPRQVEDGANA